MDMDFDEINTEIDESELNNAGFVNEDDLIDLDIFTNFKIYIDILENLNLNKKNISYTIIFKHFLNHCIEFWNDLNDIFDDLNEKIVEMIVEYNTIEKVIYSNLFKYHINEVLNKSAMILTKIPSLS